MIEMFRLQLIMTDNVLECLVGLAHSGKVSDLASIQTQVNWHHVDLWGTEILNIIKSFLLSNPLLQQFYNRLSRIYWDQINCELTNQRPTDTDRFM
jgi:hypothetical protein